MDGLIAAFAAANQAASVSGGPEQEDQPFSRPAENTESLSAVRQAEPLAGALVDASQRLRVLLADDHPLVRQGLAGLLRMEPDIELIGEALDGEMAVRMVRELQPDVVVMDVSMPLVNGIAATHHIAAEMPRVRVIVLSCYTQEEMAQALREAGAAAYLTKDAPIDELLAAIRGHEPPLPRTPK
jgi:CheY-like chemotaxis protein